MLRLASIVVFTLLSACASSPPPKPATGSPFQAQKVEGLGDPEVIIENRSGQSIALEVGGEKGGTLEVPPGARMAIKIGPGPHPFVASSPGVKPLSGEETFLVDHRYVWVFTIEGGDPEAGKGWYCYELSGLPIIDCERTEVACNARRNRPIEKDDPARGPCTPLAVPYAFVNSAENLRWFAKDEATCAKARDMYLKEVTPANPQAVEGCHPLP